jgi:hypothetical protein
MERLEAYRIIDEAGKRDVLFRLIISPDPNGEDRNRDLDMREIAQRTMLKIEEITGKTVLWVGAIHAEHTPKRYVHALAVVPGRLYTAHLNLLTYEATKVCQEQRRELDLMLAPKERERQAREEAEWGQAL